LLQNQGRLKCPAGFSARINEVFPDHQPPVRSSLRKICLWPYFGGMDCFSPFIENC